MQSTLDDSARDTNTFYRRTLHVLSDARVPFLVGGSHAYLHYTGIVRNTKDFDVRGAAGEVVRIWKELSFGMHAGPPQRPHDVFRAAIGVLAMDCMIGLQRLAKVEERRALDERDAMKQHRAGVEQLQ